MPINVDMRDVLKVEQWQVALVTIQWLTCGLLKRWCRCSPGVPATALFGTCTGWRTVAGFEFCIHLVRELTHRHSTSLSQVNLFAAEQPADCNSNEGKSCHDLARASPADYPL